MIIGANRPLFRMPDPTVYTQVSARLPNGTTLQVSVPAGSAVRAENIGARDAVFDMDRVRDAIEGVGGLVVDAFKSIKPDKASVEFGFKFAVESGNLTALFVKGTADADLKICLEWSGSGHAGG